MLRAFSRCTNSFQRGGWYARRPRMLVRRVVLGLLATAMFVGVATAVAAHEHPYLQAVLWTALVLASFVGWGGVLNYLVARNRWVDWGLRAGWGMALCVVVGGFLCVLHLVSRVTLIGQVVVGLAALLALSPRRWRPTATRCRRRLALTMDRFGVTALVVAGYALLVLFVLACFGDHAFQPSDDPALYIALSKKLMESGSNPVALRSAPDADPGRSPVPSSALPCGRVALVRARRGRRAVPGRHLRARRGPHHAYGDQNRHVVPLALALLLFLRPEVRPGEQRTSSPESSRY